MTIKGRVEGIIFRNGENGYTVLDFDTGDGNFTAVGIFPEVTEGAFLKLTGEFRRNPKFGEQFAVEQAEFCSPENAEEAVRYLSSGLFCGVGEKLARRIVDRFGDGILDILENDIERLSEVSGIGRKKLGDIIESYKKTKGMRDALIFLQKYGVSVNLALKIYRRYENAAVDLIGENPYILVEDIEGVGFITADKIAEKMGVDKRSVFRIHAGIYYVLNEISARNGHTCYPSEGVIKETAKLLRIGKDEVRDALQTYSAIKLFEIDGTEIAATARNYVTEKAVATKLLTLNLSPAEWLPSTPEDGGELGGIELDEGQKSAIRKVFSNGVSVITGGPGTGKTTIIKRLTQIAEKSGKKAILCAPTGRASKRMTETTNFPSATIHRLLEADFGSAYKFRRNETNPVSADLFIVDEISMADIYIFNALLKAVPLGARLVLIGDKDQLPSVSCGNILSDVIKSGLVPVTELTEIYRQGKESFIVTNAHRINRGLLPLEDNRVDFFVSNKSDPEEIVDTVVEMVKYRIPKFAGIEPTDIQVLTPMKKGIVGVENLNRRIQEALNPDGVGFSSETSGLYIGDKVMQNVNDYNLEWTGPDGERGSGVFNGDVGFVVAADGNGLDVLFDDDRRVRYGASELNELMLAYCASVHKAQGSEFPVVILGLYGGNNMIMTRNLLYTAITRARKMAVVVGDYDCVKRMVGNNYTARRYSMLEYFLKARKSDVENFWGTPNYSLN